MTLRSKIKGAKSYVQGFFLSVDIKSSVKKIRQKNLSYLSTANLYDIAIAIIKLRRQGIKGKYVEAGVALGGSAILIAKVKPLESRLDLFDTFSHIPEPSERDGMDVIERYKTIQDGQAVGIGGNLYYGYERDLVEKVKANMAEFDVATEKRNVIFNKGLFSETMHFKDPICFAHIDCDWYESVYTSLERISPLLVPGGIIIIDDYEDWSGCREAVDDFLAKFSTQYRLGVQWKTKLHIVKSV